MTDILKVIERLKIHSEHIELITKLEKRCAYHELKCNVIFKPYEKEKYLQVLINDQKFFSINSTFNNKQVETNIFNINCFIDSWILREQKQ